MANFTRIQSLLSNRPGYILCAMLDIKVPPLGKSITEATVARWNKNEGDAIAAGETTGDAARNTDAPADTAATIARSRGARN